MRTVGELFKKSRERKNFSLEDVAKLTKIRVSYLKAIESSDYNALPAPVFTKGFIKNYASFLGLDEDEVLAFFRREFDERTAKNKPSLEPPQPIRKTFQIFTPSTVIITVVSLLVIGFLTYIFLQYRSFSKSPDLTLEKPADRSQVSVSYAEVSGSTNEDAVIKINGQTIRTAGNGNFAITVDLAQGENKIRVSATNALGRETVIERTVYYVLDATRNESTSSAVINPPVLDIFTVIVSVGPNAAWLKVSIDGKDEFEGILNPGTKRQFSIKDTVRIRTGNGGSTLVMVNGRDLGVMGQEGVPIEKEYKKE